MKQGLKERFGEQTVKLAHRDFMEICESCGLYIEKQQYFMQDNDGFIHFKCQQKLTKHRTEFYGAYGKKVKTV